jgi:hypothetical protein
VVERLLAKEEVEGSNPFARSFLLELEAAWLGQTGWQLPLFV